MPPSYLSHTFCSSHVRAIGRLILSTIIVGVVVCSSSCLLPSETGAGGKRIPELAQWESQMLSFGRMHCKTLMTKADKYGNVQTEDMLLAATYYDAIEVFLRIQQYTKDPSWAPCVQAAKLHYRDNYVIRTNGKVPGYWNFTNGMVLDYQINADAVSKNAEILLSQNAAYAQDWVPLTSTADPSLSREVAYTIRSYVNAEKLGQPRRARLADLVTQVFGQIDRWFISKTYRCTSCSPSNPPAAAAGQYYIQPFMVGLTMEALIIWYDATTDPAEKAKVMANVKVCLDWLWANAWVPADQAFWYENWVADPSVPFPSKAGARDLNLLIAPAYAWYYKMTGDPTYQDRGDQAFAGGVSKAYLDGAKQFNQNYEYSFAYISRRQLGDARNVAPAAGSLPSASDPPNTIRK